jgi:prepilin-type N-terminal cleavage/methylation domain-containing protein
MMIRKQKLPSSPSSQSGFTLIECLIAIIIVSVLLVAVAPAVILSVATRVQARRVEVATEAARAYVDGVRAGTIPAPPGKVVLNQNKVNVLNKNLFGGVGAPSGASGWTCTPPTPATPGQPLTVDNVYCKDASNIWTLYCYDLDGGGCNSRSPRDMIVQPLRSITDNSTYSPPALTNPNDEEWRKGYILGIRVYRASAFNTNGSLKTSVNPQDSERARRQLTYAGGLGDQSMPILEFTTEIGPTGSSYEAFRDRLGIAPTQTPPTTPP